MSRVGKQPIVVPGGVKVSIAADAVEVQGPKGKLRQYVPPGIRFELSEGELSAQPVRSNDKSLSKFH